ncbi:hypothetical protein SuNHUV7_05370 (plasmid) [Pseudoseohaeicola sp. NH-UV-7]
MKLYSTLLFAVAFLVAPGSHAQTQPSATDNTCHAMVIPDMLHGDYHITAGPLQMTIAGNVMFPEGETSGPGTIYPGPLREYMVKMVPPIPEFRLEETDALQPDWYWDAAPAGSTGAAFYISSNDLEIVVNCKISDMPRFVGTFQTMSQQGTPLDHTIRVVMALPDWLIGSWRWQSNTSNGPVEGLRYVIFDRTTASIGQ